MTELVGWNIKRRHGTEAARPAGSANLVFRRDPATGLEVLAESRTQPGCLVPGKGVYLGTWSPRDRSGNSLNKTFNLYAAPHDLGLDENGRGTRLVTIYNNAVVAVGNITSLMGFAGFRGKNDTDLYNALRDGSYRGEWFLPTREILCGRDVDGNALRTNHLFGNRHRGALAGTFMTADVGSGSAHWYWSCSGPRDLPSYVWAVVVTDGHDDWDLKDYSSLSSRLVRVEPAAP